VDGPRDGSDDHQYSRAPGVDDLIELCRALNEAGALYVLIGGFAVILQGYVRATKDVDLLVDLSPENILAVKAGMASLPDNAVSLMENDEVERFGESELPTSSSSISWQGPAASTTRTR